jgi:hypothetical protein
VQAAATVVFLVLTGLTGCAAAWADDCDTKAAELVAREGAVVVGQRTQVRGITLKHPHATEVDIECPNTGGIPMDLYLNWHGADPPTTFYGFAGRAGSILTGAPSKVIAEGATKCQQTALRSSTEFCISYLWWRLF